ncbi:MAG: imidazole glycerol phosphate synthase subunit HisH [Candidatus Saccharicenans sp.]|uniref:imidazole glycerol phosphate synthase subunit HisH n=1 Tax=Candidatus Saccharicenans sp. TaxID=2819258 RepID=UPI00404AB17A
MIGIVDYGAGNLNSVIKAFVYLKLKARVVTSPEDMDGLEKLVIPGVGSFGAALYEMRKRNLYRSVVRWIREDKPLLGICLGFQLLFEKSEETPAETGFSFFKGHCQKIRADKVPHTGWNTVRVVREDQIFEGLNQAEFFYFVHSYAVYSTEEEVLGLTEYGNDFVSVIKSGRIYGVQFHPEKSGETGLRLLWNWWALC